MTVWLEHGDMRVVLQRLLHERVQIDAIVTDPPYGLEFMGKEWDAPWQVSSKSALFGSRKTKMPGWSTTRNPTCKNCGGRLRGARKCGCEVSAWDEAPNATRLRQMAAFQDWFQECAELMFAVLPPGGHALVFGGTRTYHRMVCAMEDAGFEIRDMLSWIYGSGFPKSLNVGNGFGTALKPACEPICMARKPLDGTVAANVLKHGTGAINIDGCRIATDEIITATRNVALGSSSGGIYGSANKSGVYEQKLGGRWPANIVHDGSDDVIALFPEQKSGGTPPSRPRDKTRNTYGKFNGQENPDGIGSTSGNASRFFYAAKANKKDRCDSKHPTVKPISLMRWLVRLVTPPGGMVLDPFAGSGTTGEACQLEGFDCTLIEREDEYVTDIRRRLPDIQVET